MNEFSIGPRNFVGFRPLASPPNCLRDPLSSLASPSDDLHSRSTRRKRLTGDLTSQSFRPSKPTFWRLYIRRRADSYKSNLVSQPYSATL